MVARDIRQARHIEDGSSVRFLTDQPDSNILKGDVGLLKISKTKLPRGRGVVTSYTVEFEEGDLYEVSPKMFLQVVGQSPSVKKYRADFWRNIFKSRTTAGPRRIKQGWR